MPIEVLDDIIEELADRLGIYGADSYHNDQCRCRVCWSAGMKGRITRAVEIERKLAYQEIETRVDREREVRRLGQSEQG